MLKKSSYLEETTKKKRGKGECVRRRVGEFGGAQRRGAVWKIKGGSFPTGMRKLWI